MKKYKANRSFAEWSSKSVFEQLDYEYISSYTAELFENFMEYKQLLKLVHDIMENRSGYKSKMFSIGGMVTTSRLTQPSSPSSETQRHLYRHGGVDSSARRSPSRNEEDRRGGKKKVIRICPGLGKLIRHSGRRSYERSWCIQA